MAQKPFAPRRYCATTKLRPADGCVPRLASELQKILQEGGRRDLVPKWATIERSPEIGGCKAKAMGAVGVLKQLGEGWEIDLANGAVCDQRVTVARMIRSASSYKRAANWAMVQEPRWDVLKEALEKPSSV